MERDSLDMRDLDALEQSFASIAISEENYNEMEIEPRMSDVPSNLSEEVTFTTIVTNQKADPLRM